MNSSQLFGITTIAYLLSSVCYIGLFVFRNKKAGQVGLGLAVLGILAQTIGLGLRWQESYTLGIGHAPLTNMYESLLFFAWCAAIFYVLLEIKFKLPVIGAFAMPIPFITLAYTSVDKGLSRDISPLVPALQSNWLIAHVITCFIGYGAFAVAAGLGILYLLKGEYDGHTVPQLFFSFKGRIRRWIYFVAVIAQSMTSIVLAVCCYFVFDATIHPAVKTIALFFLIPVSLVSLWSHVPLSIKRLHDFNLAWPWIFIPGINTILLVWPGNIKENKFGPPSKDTVKPEFGNILTSLPAQRDIDDIIHKTIIFGFMWLSAGIITGAVWANEAWGTYWSWDPKETWSIITWFVYALTLHARFTRGWNGSRIAWLAVIGFISVFFTYFGVNYLLAGLHSYGSN
jgi:cytochrome c-type biogenesis protein CcsB